MSAIIPHESMVQFARANGSLFIDELIDPSDRPVDVFRVPDGFVLKGRVRLPGWLTGKGVITLSADEIGGPIDKEIGSVTVDLAGGNTPDFMTYAWQLEVKPVPLDQDRMYQMGLVFVLQTPNGGHTDIGAFYDLGAYLVV